MSTTERAPAAKPAVEISMAQHRLLHGVIEEREACGDCLFNRCKLRFEDYEGAAATLRAVMAVRTKTTREYVTWNSVVDRINAVIRNQFGGGR
jgi:hypothetical protein